MFSKICCISVFYDHLQIFTQWQAVIPPIKDNMANLSVFTNSCCPHKFLCPHIVAHNDVGTLGEVVIVVNIVMEHEILSGNI